MLSAKRKTVQNRSLFVVALGQSDMRHRVRRWDEKTMSSRLRISEMIGHNFTAFILAWNHDIVICSVNALSDANQNPYILLQLVA